MYTVDQVADWFLSRDSMRHKKLQKLCYYAQAWYCALYDNGPLFEEEIQAWIHGPVVPALYHQYKHYHWNKIPKKDCKVDFDSDTLELLEIVYYNYSDLTADELETLTHSEDPWIQARKDTPPYLPSEEVITLESMTEYYGARYEETQGE